MPNFLLTIGILFLPYSGAVWMPSTHSTWQWQINTGHVDTTVHVDVYDIDLFDTSSSLISYLHSHGRKVICYFSAGTYEEWRSDAGDFPHDSLGNNLDHWPGERWLDITNSRVKTIMAARLDRAKHHHCDGVEPDNVDGYSNDNGKGLTASDQLAYNMWLAREAHARGLSVGLKNDVEQISKLQPYFDWALNESCMKYNECFEYQPFIDAGKAVFHVEYVSSESQGGHKKSEVCHSNKRPHQFLTLIKKQNLDDWRLSC